MALSKRIRYEILRRDNHSCRYCGAAAPEAKLTVDHVTPVALGGTNEPSNLVAACRDCNAGKSSTPPDAALVEDVRQDALRHAELVRGAYEVLVQRMGDRDAYIEEWAEAYTYQPLPDNWRDSIGRWFEMGVPIELVVDAAERACRNPRTFSGDGRFKYMCAIVWNQVRMVDEAAEAKRHLAGWFLDADSLDEALMSEYQVGRDTGYRLAGKDLARVDYVSLVVDQIFHD